MSAGPDLEVLFRRNNYRPPAVHEARSLGSDWLSDPLLKQAQLRSSRQRTQVADLREQVNRVRLPARLRAEARALRRRSERTRQAADAAWLEILTQRTLARQTAARSVRAGDSCGFCRQQFADCQRCEGAVCGCGHLTRPGRRSCAPGR